MLPDPADYDDRATRERIEQEREDAHYMDDPDELPLDEENEDDA